MTASLWQDATHTLLLWLHQCWEVGLDWALTSLHSMQLLVKANHHKEQETELPFAAQQERHT